MYADQSNPGWQNATSHTRPETRIERLRSLVKHYPMDADIRVNSMDLGALIDLAEHGMKTASERKTRLERDWLNQPVDCKTC